MTDEIVDKVEIPEYGDGEDSSTTEAQATSLGWKPLEDFKGDPEKWTDAEAFLEIHGRNNGRLREANEKTVREMADLRRQVEQNSAMSKQIFEAALKKQKQEFDDQVAFLKAQKRNALREGDHDTAASLDEQIDDLKERGPESPGITPPQNTQQKDWTEIPELVEFNTRNPWMETDEDMSSFVIGRAQRLRQQNPGMSLSALLSQVEAAARKAFPAKFGPARARSPVDAGERGGNSPNAGGKTYQAMPKEAREACDEFVADGKGKREAYVKMYFEYDDIARRRS